MSKQTSKPLSMSDATLCRIGDTAGVSPPCLSYDGTAPVVGQYIVFELSNGVVYSGEVSAVTEVAGSVFIEFVAGIQPVPRKTGGFTANNS